MGHNVVESTDNICGATKPDTNSHAGSVKGEGWVCGRPEGHSGKHKDRLTGREW